MSKKTKIISIAVSVVLIIILIVVFNMNKVKAPVVSEEINPAIIQEMELENIKLTQIKISSGNIIIDYTQPIEFEMNDMFANWTYLIASAMENVSDNAEIKNVMLNCNFEDGEKVEISTSAENVISFMEGEITIEELFSKLQIKPLTDGPII